MNNHTKSIAPLIQHFVVSVENFITLRFNRKDQMNQDIVFDLIQKEYQRQSRGIELIASENFVSQAVLDAMGSCLTNKYAEGLPSKRYYGGCEVVDEVENLAIERLKKLFKATWVNVQPHSGAQANAAVMLALLKPGDKILGLNLAHGGHLTHGSPVNFSGRNFIPLFYGVKEDTGLIDYDQMEKIAFTEKPKLIICGASAYSRDWDYARIRSIADSINAIVLADIAHPAGLIATGLLRDALEHCHVVTSTTHKTLRGPRGGIIMLRHDIPAPTGEKTPKGQTKMLSQILDSAVFPGTQGGPLMHVIAAKAVAFGEALQPEFTTYCKQIIQNAKALANALLQKGYQIVSHGTDNHLMLIDLRNKNLTGKIAENALVKADITVNKNMVPFDTQSPLVTSGIRIGTAAITTRGLKEPEMQQIAQWIDTILSNPTDENTITKVQKEVHSFMQNFPLPYTRP